MNDHTLEVLEYAEIRRLLLSFTQSELAHDIIKRMRPSSDEARLRRSLEQVNQARELLDRQQEVPLSGLRDIGSTIADARRMSRPLGAGELLSIAAMLLACERLKSFLLRHQEEAPALGALGGAMEDFSDLRKSLEDLVEAPGVVVDGASPKLWELRRKKSKLEDTIRQRMQDLATGKKFRPFLQEQNWSLRGGRHVLMVRTDSRGHVRGILHDKSASGETVFIEPQEVVAMSNELADVQLDEDREVTRILLETSQHIFELMEALRKTQSVAAWVDFTATKARMSAALSHVPARFSEDGLIRLRGAAHPLLLESHRQGNLQHPVVPFTLSLGDPFRMIVITGPNTGGKTVCMKTVGLIQLMFQSGMHVPALPGTELPCLDAIHADIGDEQSLSQSLSTFSGHIRNMVPILLETRPRVLVLLDELGAGTDPAEGAPLGEAILDRLMSMGGLSLVSTHLGNLKTYAFSRPDVENASMAFDPKTLGPTFELVIGQPGSSQALHIAERHGIPKDVVDRARALTKQEDRATDELMDQLMVTRMEAEKRRQKSDDLLVESEERLRDAEGALQEAEASRGRIEAEAESEVQRVMTEVFGDARPHLNALKNVPKSLVEHVDALEQILGRRRTTQSLAARRREFIGSLKKHDQVYVPKLSQVCRVTRIHRAEEKLQVKVGNLTMELEFDDISWVTPPELT